MRDLFIKIFSSETTGPEIKLFNIWHILFIILIISLTFLFVYLVKNKTNDQKIKINDYLAIAVFTLYIVDFFIQPFYNNDQLIIDKLPFHICTVLAPLIMISRFSNFGKKWKKPLAVLSLVASLMYLTYPGSAIGDISVFSYKVLQTFIYHGVMFAYGIFVLTSEECILDYRKIYQELIIIAIVIVWAFIGNHLYSTESHHYDWFFITGSTFPFIPSWLMPFVVLVAVFAMVNIIYLIYFGVKKFNQYKKNKN